MLFCRKTVKLLFLPKKISEKLTKCFMSQSWSLVVHTNDFEVRPGISWLSTLEVFEVLISHRNSQN